MEEQKTGILGQAGGEWSPGLFHDVQKLDGLPNELHQLFRGCKTGLGEGREERIESKGKKSDFLLI